ncbi:hypothetical protein PHMEG_00011343 [Phytophthora megakarya]|uniref:Uncharacterized protein n=1 Tax=Phytophthora megakarya TaxID=4795 RepID=A0A225WCF4_9STRA|nr:hypothetical protein PHMEG_00011343 [Phytophthora megakarya]
MTTTTPTAYGATIWNCRPYIGYSNLDKLDEKAGKVLRHVPKRNCNRYTDWYTQLPKSMRHDWKLMSKRFGNLYMAPTLNDTSR